MGNKKVFINGCFDILHPGHVKLFEYAKSLGDYLMVAVDSDERVKELKGDQRPFNKLRDRMYVLSSIKYIDRVERFSSEEHLITLIKGYKPDIMVVGSDYKNKKVVGSEFVKDLRFFERIDGYSTTKSIQSFIDR